MKIGFNGIEGSGKTTGITALGYVFHNKYNKEIYANYKISFGDMISLDDMLKFDLHDCVLLLTETHTFFDSRLSTTTINRNFSYFSLQSRKRNIDIFYDAQIIGAVDLRLVNVSNFIIDCYNTEKGFYYMKYTPSGIFVNDFYIYNKAIKFLRLMFDSNEVIIPYLLNRDIDVKDIKKIFDNCDNRQVFSVLIKKKYPQLASSDIIAVYSLIKKGDIKTAKEILS